MKQHFDTIHIKSLRWDYFKGSGKGGQKRNKTENCARCTHESGAQGKAEDSRSKKLNKDKALKRMLEDKQFDLWLSQRLFDHFGEHRRYSVEVKDEVVDIYDLGKLEEIKRKKVKRKPVMKDKNKDDRRRSKNQLKKFTL